MAYSKEEIETIFNSICERVENGESVKSVLRDKDMPSSQTFWKWIKEDESKSNQYARAKETWADSVFEDIILISDGTGDDVLIDENGFEQVNHNIIQRDRLRIDARKWALGKINPKKYGDKLELDNKLSGEITIDFKD